MPTIPDLVQIAIRKLQQARRVRFQEVDQDGHPTDRAPHVFALNPSKVQVKRPKVEQYELSKAGFDRQFWQNDLITFSYSGSSGAFLPSTNQPGIISDRGRVIYDLRATKRWIQFRNFEIFYEEVGPENVRMDYFSYDYLLVGSLTDFQFDEDADRPGHIAYSFTFKGFPRVPVPITTEISAASLSPEDISTMRVRGV